MFLYLDLFGNLTQLKHFGIFSMVVVSVHILCMYSKNVLYSVLEFQFYIILFNVVLHCPHFSRGFLTLFQLGCTNTSFLRTSTSTDTFPQVLSDTNYRYLFLNLSFFYYSTFLNTALFYQPYCDYKGYTTSLVISWAIKDHLYGEIWGPLYPKSSL